MRKSMPGLTRQAPKSRKRKWPNSAWNPQPFTASGTTPSAPRITRKCDTYFLTDPKDRTDGSFPYAGLILSDNTLYGTSNRGGSYDTGTVFKLNTDGTGFTNLNSFTGGED